MEASIESGHAIDARPLATMVEIVEQEDVAFTLGVCREVHRIYGDYLQGGVLPVILSKPD